MQSSADPCSVMKAPCGRMEGGFGAAAPGGFCLQFRGIACNLCNAAFVCISCKLTSGEWHEAKALDQQVSDVFVAEPFYSKQVSQRSFIPGFLSSLAFASSC